MDVNMDEESHLLGRPGVSAAGSKGVKTNDTWRLGAAFMGGLLIAMALSHATSGGAVVASSRSGSETFQQYEQEELYARSHYANKYNTKDFHTKSSSSNKKSKYTKFQHLGFQIYTGGAPVEIPGEVGVKNPECFGLNTHGQAGEISEDDLALNITNTLWQCYLGHTNPAHDVQQRLSIMTDAVEKAHDVASKDEETLKIFIAPE